MTDHLQQPSPQDAGKNSDHAEWEILYWTQHFGCTREQLLAAIESDGTAASALEKYVTER